MNLKEATKEKHKLAEETKFMQAIFKGKLPLELWYDYTYQRHLIYNAIEAVASSCGLLKDLPDIQRTFYLYNDIVEMFGNNSYPRYKKTTVDYHRYILDLFPNSEKILAHLYVWHMGDMYGGQMIKKMIPGSHRSLTFKDTELLKNNLRAKLNDNMADEANIAFDWAIKLLNEYNVPNLE